MTEKFKHFRNKHVYVKFFEAVNGSVEVYDEKMEVFHTELEKKMFIYKRENKWYTELKGEYVVYKREDGTGYNYMRPKEMFYDDKPDPDTGKLVKRFQKL